MQRSGRRTSRPARAPKRTGLAAVIARSRNRPAEKAQYFDFDLLMVIVFLMCFGAFALEIYIFSMILMALVQTPLGVTVNGARRWIGLPGNMTLQPAEITKIAVILFISYELCRLGRKAYTMEGIIRVLVLGAVASGGVLFLTDNLSTAIIVMAITCILIFVIHPKTKPFLAVIGAGAAVAAIGIAILSVTEPGGNNGYRKLSGNAGTVCNRKRGIFRKGTWEQHAEVGSDSGSAERYDTCGYL